MPREDFSPVTGEQSSYNNVSCLKQSKVSDREEHVYTLLARPFGKDTQPEHGFLRHQDSESTFGQVVFDHFLSPSQCRRFALRPDSGLQGLVGKAYVRIAPSGQSGISQLSVESYDAHTGIFQVSRGIYGKEQQSTSMDWQDIIALLESQEWQLSLQNNHHQSNL